MRRSRSPSLILWSATFTIAACNTIWGIDDGELAPPRSVQAGAVGAEAAGAPHELGGAPAGAPAENAGEIGSGAAPGAAGDAASAAGASTGNGGSISGSGGSVSGSGGSMSGASGTSPMCSGCKAGDAQSEGRACGRCGTGTQSHSRTCGADCTWGAWSAWTNCSQCDTKQYRCCGAGKWEWCYESDCAWTNSCAACSASSCPEC